MNCIRLNGKMARESQRLVAWLAAATIASGGFFSSTAIARGDSEENKAPLLKGGVEYCIPKATPLKLKLATVPTHGLELLDHDLDGNLLPARLGQEITAKVTDDMYVDDNKVIPEGTLFHGKSPRFCRRVGPGDRALWKSPLTN